MDDGTFVTKLNVVNDYEEREDGRVRRKRDLQTQNLFRRTVRRATEQGMKVNTNKTAMVTVSDSLSFQPVAFIEDEGGSVIEGDKDRVKIVGFHFGNRPNVSLHISEIVSRVRRGFWMIRHLKRHGLNEKELVRVYMSNVRSCIEFSSVVYGPMLTSEQDEDLEKLQRQCLKMIYGFDKSYHKLLEISGLEKLSERREKAIIKFAQKCATGKYASWFPLNYRGGRARRSLKYREDYARCVLLKNSPIYYMHRALNRLEA